MMRIREVESGNILVHGRHSESLRISPRGRERRDRFTSIFYPLIKYR